MAHQQTRRNFLKQCLGSMAVSSIMVSGKTVAQSTAKVPEVKHKPQRGYHETEHIRSYYQKTNF